MQDAKVYRFSDYYVCFGGNKTQWWTKFLKKGFYHCFLLAREKDSWLIIDHVMGYTDIVYLENTDALKTIRDKGYTVVKAEANQNPCAKCHIFRPFTCVETVKHFLGISNPWIFTPHQLYRYIVIHQLYKYNTKGKQND